jgi:drug/metabolite transporter (DMT)-like permease
MAVLNSFTPVATLVVAVLAGQEQLYRNRVAGLAIAVTGMVTVVGGEVGSGKSLGALLVAVLATAGYAIAGVVTRARLSRRVPNLQAAALQLLAGAAVVWPLAWHGSGAPPVHLDPVVAGALAGLGLFGTGLGFLMYFTLIERVGATNAAMVTYVVPIVGLVSGAMFRGERFGFNVFAGAALLILGVWLSQRQPVSAGALSGVARTL